MSPLLPRFDFLQPVTFNDRCMQLVTLALKRSELVIAALATLGCGMLLTPSLSGQWLVMGAIIIGTLGIYGFNDWMDRDLSFTLTEILALAVVTALAAATLMAILPGASILSLFAGGILGVIYSIPGKIHFKKIFLIKNVMIAAGWAMLVSLGAGSFTEPFVIEIQTFIFIQVLIGSCLRDFSDIVSDRNQGVLTLPNELGPERSVVFLHIFNLLSLAPACFAYRQSPALGLGLAGVVAWRALLLEMVRKGHRTRGVLQRANLLTCSIIFLCCLCLI